MLKKTLFRTMMLAAGLLAVAVILISSSTKQVSAHSKEKAKTEQGEKSAQTYVSAPTEAIPGSAVKVDEPAPSLQEVLFGVEEEEVEIPTRTGKELMRYMKVLFRAIISPNAP